MIVYANVDDMFAELDERIDGDPDSFYRIGTGDLEIIVDELTKPYAKILLMIIVLITALSLSACGSSPTPTVEPIVDCPPIDNVEPESFHNLWESSPHADEEAEAFRHWDAEDPKEIPVECAKCHSRPGFIDFIGADGSTEDDVDNPAKIGTTISCFVCQLINIVNNFISSKRLRVPFK